MLLTDFFFLNSVNANLSNSLFLAFSLIFYELYIIAFEEKKKSRASLLLLLSFERGDSIL